MKKNLISFIVLIGIFYLLIGTCNIIETTYIKNAVVDSVEENIVIFKDSEGNLWSWEKEETEKEYTPNEKVKLIMYTNWTDNNSFDDEIKKVKRGY